MNFYDIQMKTGIFSGEKLGELTKYIIDKFAEEKLSRDEAVEVLGKVREVIGEVAIIKKMD